MNKKIITFIDLFSGIGGFRLALEANKCKCVFSSDIDKWANETYFMNFGEYPHGDITKIESEKIPEHDILCAGFPCQPFSIAGKRLGFADTRGTLFFEIERIIKDKKPRAFILENVKGLINHNKGNTFSTIIKKLKKMGYKVKYQVLNSKDFGVPQNRERIYIVGFRENNKFKFPKKMKKMKKISEILEKNIKKNLSKTALKNLNKHYNKLDKTIKYTNPIIFATELRPSRCVFRTDGLSPCLTAKMGTGGNNIPVILPEKRQLTIRECLRLQGFPDTYIMKKSSQSYKQIGNSVTINVIEEISKEMLKYL